jgi:hypothetical protein
MCATQFRPSRYTFLLISMPIKHPVKCGLQKWDIILSFTRCLYRCKIWFLVLSDG